MGMTQRIGKFSGPNRFLSNFWPCSVTLGSVTYPSAEHGFQASKTLDGGARLAIAGLASPGEAKRAGRRLQLRPDWEASRKRVMLLTVLGKFIQNPELARQLVATEDALLVEGNTWHDNYWGSCTCPDCGAGDLDNGENWLGRILMFVRDILRQDG